MPPSGPTSHDTDAPMAHLSLDPIVTPRLHLRDVAEADLVDLLRINGDPEVTRFLPYAPWSGLDDARSWLHRMRELGAAGTGRQLVLVQRDGGRVIGTLLLFRFDAVSARLELGYVLGRAHWGQGWMHEALQATCVAAFTQLGMRRLEAEVNPANRASTRLLERLGFTLEGRLRQRWVARGEAYDTHLYGLLADDGHPAPPVD
jgi:RimJ/RimL family protein N-acetyltransferase